MYQKILAPLDGSNLSECSLPYVKSIASGCNVPKVVLFEAVEPISAETIEAIALKGGKIGKITLKNKEEALKYLTGVSKELKKEQIKSDLVVSDAAPPAQAILDYAENNKIDLIILTTHGRSGPSRWFAGSVAEKVINHSKVPVLIVSPPGCRIG
jgi:nucleotide-binding universal stress UspA family protein